MAHDPQLSSPAPSAAALSSWEAERHARREAEASAARLARLQAVTAALSGARTPAEVAEVALGAGIEALGGARGYVLVAGAGGDLEVLRCSGIEEETARVAASAPGPARDAFHASAAIFVEGGDDLLARWPTLGRTAARMVGAGASLPLVVHRRALGVLAVVFEAPRPFGEAERAFAVGLAGQCAQALERARLFTAERVARAEADAARRRLAFLDGLSAELAETVDPSAMLEGVARLVVPALGEWVGIYLAGADGSLALAAHRGPPVLGAAFEAHLRRGARARIERSFAGGDVVVVDDFPADLAGDRAAQAAVVAPLRAHGAALGIVAIASSDAGRVPGGADSALVADVAHRTAVALEHARLLAEATAAARAREEFLHVASHELRAPISTIRLTVHLLRRDARSGCPDAYEGRLRVLDRQVARMVALSETLLDGSRITAGQLELSREEVDAAALVSKIAARFVDDAAEQGSVVEMDAPHPVRCVLDPMRLDQIASNLLSNAVKYGCGRPISVRVRGEDGRARLEVEDRGIGIAPADQERIFRRFERAVSSRNYAGLGLGLWIVRRLVEAHGGAIAVRSAPGEGSTFAVELPLSPP